MATPVIDEVSTFLHYCQRGNVTGVQEYVNNYPQVLNSIDKGLWGALHYAAHGDHPEILNILIKAGVSLDTLNGAGETALQIAATKGYIDCILPLARAGADANIKNSEGLTAYDLAPNDGARRALGGYDPRVQASAGTTFQQAHDSDSE